MRTLHFYALILYFVFLIFAGIILFSPLAIFLSIPILWIIIFSEILPFKPARIKRRFPEKRYVEGNKVKFEYGIEGHGYYYMQDAINTLRGFCKGKCRDRKVVELKQFGKVEFREMFLYSEDVLGIKGHTRRFRDKGELKIYPRIEYIRKLKIKPRKTRSILGDYPSRRKGAGMEFTDIREYAPGDDMRWINWKATARRGELMVNEYESERTGDTVILLDARRFLKGAEEYEKLLNASARAAATLATYLARTRSRVGFVMLGKTVDWIYPTYGKRAMYLILDRLLHLRSEKLSRLTFDYGKFIVSRFFPPNSFVILISPLLSWDIDDAIVELLARGYDILVISPTLIGEGTDMASKILKAEREVRLRRLRIYGRVIDWNIEYPLTSMLKVMK